MNITKNIIFIGFFIFSYFLISQTYANSDISEETLRWLKQKPHISTFDRFKKEAEQGDTNAQILLGRMYAIGDGVEKDIKQAMFWFEKSANSGSSWAKTILGSIYRNGKYVTKDVVKAKFWYKKAAAQGDKSAKDYLEKMNEK